MRRLFLLAFVLPFFAPEVAGSTEIPSLKGDNGNLDDNSVDSQGQNGTMPGMQDYGAVIRPTKRTSDEKGGPGCVNYFMHVAMLTDKQAEIEKLKGEVARLKIEKENKLEIDGLKKNDEELAERIKKLELEKEGKSEGISKTDVLAPVNETKQCECPQISNKTQEETIMLIGGFRTVLFLSLNRSKWIVPQLKLPYTIGTGGAVYLNGEIYVFGVSDKPKALYKLDKNLKWIRLSDMNIGRKWITYSCLAWNGYIWVFGGQDEDDNWLKSVERYDPKTDKWTLMPAMKYPRSGAAAALWYDKFIISGGWGSDKTTEYFNFKTASWTELSNLLELRNHALVSYRGTIVAIGGNVSHGDKVWELDLLGRNGAWQPLQSMKYGSQHFSAIVLDDKIYAIGGRDTVEKRNVARVEIFEGNNWRDGPSLPYPIWAASAMIIPQSLADRLITYKP